MKIKKRTSKIIVDTKIHFGKPVVAGTRIPVYVVLELVETGIPFKEITTHYYPDITIGDVKACIEYAIELIKAEDVYIAAS